MATQESENFWRNKSVLVTGGAGFLGRCVVSRLIVSGASADKILVPRSKDWDLRVPENCRRVMEGQDVVIHLAARVGGIGANKEYSYEFYYDNLLMGTHLFHHAMLARVEKFVTVGTVCEYPRYTPTPFKEEDLWDGFPEETNAPYGLAKKMLLVQGQAARQQYRFNSIHLLQTNLYGPGDNFDLGSSHVIPALIRKFVSARLNGDEEVVVWGTGKPTREFLYVEDAAEAIVLASEKYNREDPINIGSSFEISIGELAGLIKGLTGFTGRISFDSTKPDGQPRRKLDITKAKKEFGFRSKISFEEGLRRTISWYEQERATKA